MGRARHVIWPNQKTCILVIVILSSILAAGIVQDSLLEKANTGGEVETTGGYFYHPDWKFFPFPSNSISIANH